MKDIKLQNDTLCWLLEIGISVEGTYGQGLSKILGFRFSIIPIIGDSIKISEALVYPYDMGDIRSVLALEDISPNQILFVSPLDMIYFFCVQFGNVLVPSRALSFLVQL